jgi:hypothetical protein
MIGTDLNASNWAARSRPDAMSDPRAADRHRARVEGEPQRCARRSSSSSRLRRRARTARRRWCRRAGGEGAPNLRCALLMLETVISIARGGRIGDRALPGRLGQSWTTHKIPELQHPGPDAGQPALRSATR